MNAARVRLNDILPTIQPLNRGILQTNMDFTQQCVNNAWAKLRQGLTNEGYTKIKQETLLTGLPIINASVQNDPAAQCWLDWTGYFDGVSLNTGYVLPQDFINPLKLWERQNGSLGIMTDPPMEYMLDGLPAVPHSNFNLRWEWRNNKIYVPGTLQSVDLRIRYERFDGAFVDQTSPSVVRWFQQSIPILDCIDAFSLFIVAEFCASRGQSDVAAGFMTQAQGAMKFIMNRDIRMKQRVQVRRKSTSGRLEAFNGGSGFGFGG